MNNHHSIDTRLRELEKPIENDNFVDDVLSSITQETIQRRPTVSPQLAYRKTPQSIVNVSIVITCALMGLIVMLVNLPFDRMTHQLLNASSYISQLMLFNGGYIEFIIASALVIWLATLAAGGWAMAQLRAT